MSDSRIVVTYAVPGAKWKDCKEKLYHQRSCDWDCPHCGAEHLFGAHNCHGECDHPMQAVFGRYDRLYEDIPFPAPALEFGQIDKGENRLAA